MSSYLLAVAVAVVVLAAAVLVPFLSVSAHASFPQWLSDRFYSFLSHTLSFLHLSCCLHFLTSNQWLVCFTLLGWDLNYSALRIIFVVSISRVDPKKESSNRKIPLFRKRKLNLIGGEAVSELLRGIIHTYRDRHHTFSVFFSDANLKWKRKIVNCCEDVVNLNVLYPAIIYKSCLGIATCNSEGKSIDKDA